MTYTGLAIAGVALALLLDLVVLRSRVLTRRVFWVSYGIVVFFQLLTNGWLTGRDIVVYAESEILGTRLVFAPVEDLLFGFSLVVQTTAWWIWWGRRERARGVSAGAARGASGTGGLGQGPERRP